MDHADGGHVDHDLGGPGDVVRRWVHDLKNAHDPEAAPEIVSPDFTNYTPAPTALFREGENLFAVMRTALPDLHVEIEDQVVEGDRARGKVATRQTFSGTFTGTFRGRPGTGRRVEWNVIDIVTVVDGRITDHWAVADNLPLLAALTEEQP